MELDIRKAEPTVQAWQSDKKSPEKYGFDFFGDFVLTEELTDGAGRWSWTMRKAEPTVQVRQSDREARYWRFVWGSIFPECYPIYSG